MSTTKEFGAYLGWELGKDYPEWANTQPYVETISKGYLFKDETPREAYERVSNSVAKYLGKPELANKFFEYIWKGWLCLATPVLINTGTNRGLPISCLAGDTWIHTKHEGGTQIKDLKVGDLVLTHKGRFKPVTNISSRPSTNDVYELKVTTRRTPIKITGNHPVLTNLGWVRVDELDPNIHYIATSKNIEYKSSDYTIDFSKYSTPSLDKSSTSNSGQFQATSLPSVKVDKDLAWAFGLWFAEGSLSSNKGTPNGIRITTHIDEDLIAKRWQDIFCSKLGLNGGHYITKVNRNNKVNQWRNTNINSVILGNFVATEFGLNCKTKNIPNWIKDLPVDLLREFFRGFYDGDGKKVSSVQEFTISNPKLAMSLYEIGLKCGYRMGLQMQEKAGKFATTRYVYRVTIYDNQGLKLSKNSAYSGIEFNDGLIYCPFELKKLDINLTVYDITVEDDHSFSACGVIVHNCYGVHVADSIYSIGEKNLEMMVMAKSGGGVGINISDIRPAGSPITNNGTSDGVVPFCKIYDSSILATNQGNARRGSAVVNLNIDHPDFEEWLEIREPKGDINRQSLNLHQSVIISNEFMRRVEAGDELARRKWSKLLYKRRTSGEPYIIFIDTINLNNPKAYKNNNLKVSMSNLCSEICLYTDPLHSFVCCLSSLNLAKYHEWKNTDLVETAIWFLDGVMSEFIDKAKKIKGMECAVRFSEKSRALGLGTLGWNTFLQQEGLPFDSKEANQWTVTIFKQIKEQAYKASQDLAKEYGEPEWCKGTGMRNTHTSAIAPTVSNSKLSGNVSPGIEPWAANIYTEQSAKGNFIRKNTILESVLDKIGINTEDTWQKIMADNGSVQGLDELDGWYFVDGKLMKEQTGSVCYPVKDVFKTFVEINQIKIVHQQAIRQQYIDQAVSLNLKFPSDASPKFINQVHLEAWKIGLKTLYYMRSESVLKADTGLTSMPTCQACDG